MPWNTRYTTFKVALDCDYDIGDLSGILVDARRTDPGPTRSHLTDNALKELVRVCYYASLRKEEGTFPRFRAFAHPQPGKKDGLRTAMRFDPPIPIDVEALRKLAAAFPTEASLLVVDESPGGLVLIAAMSPHMASAGGRPGEPRLWDASRIGGLEISVDGPADLRVWEGVAGLHYRAGRVREMASFELESIGRGWLDDLGGRIVSQAASETGIPAAEKLFGGGKNATQLLGSVLNRGLGIMVGGGHGGALVMCPGPTEGVVDIGYSLDDFDVPSSSAT